MKIKQLIVIEKRDLEKLISDYVNEQLGLQVDYVIFNLCEKGDMRETWSEFNNVTVYVK